MSCFLVRADADIQTGTGHLMRMLGLAHYWKSIGDEVVFFSRCRNQELRERVLDSGSRLIEADAHDDDFVMARVLEEAGRLKSRDPLFMPWIVMDGYQFDTASQMVVKDAGYPLLFVDDYGHAGHYLANIILNQNLSADEALYTEREPYTEMLLGPEFTVLRREFLQHVGRSKPVPDVARRLLVTLGGSDAGNVTEKILYSLQHVKIDGFEVRAVVGAANPNIDRLRLLVPKLDFPCRIVTRADMPSEMLWADAAVIAGGTTCLETAFLGLPSATVVVADNQARAAAVLAEKGIAVNLGWYHDRSEAEMGARIEEFLLNAELRGRCSLAGRALIDGEGVKRITRKIMLNSIKLRPVTPMDCDRVWSWANDPLVRAASFNSEPILLETHQKWFHERLQRPDIVFLMASTDRGVPIGYARFEPGDGCLVISVLVAEGFRGLGIGKLLIEKACIRFTGDISGTSVKAFIKSDNKASRGAFSAAGFQYRGMTMVKGCEAVEMEYMPGKRV